jgi:hypothetical protein
MSYVGSYVSIKLLVSWIRKKCDNILIGLGTKHLIKTTITNELSREIQSRS